MTVVPPQCVHDCPASLYYVGHAHAGLNYGCRSTVCYCYSYWHSLLQLLGMLVQCTGYVLQFEGCLPLISLSHAHLEHIPVHLICINLRAKQQHSRRHNICLLTYTMPVVHWPMKHNKASSFLPNLMIGIRSLTFCAHSHSHTHCNLISTPLLSG